MGMAEPIADSIPDLFAIVNVYLVGILCPSCGLGGDAMGRVVSGRPEAYKEGRLSFQND